MKQYTVDFTKVKTYMQFYDALVTGLEFPDWCGRNMDAIWDLLTGYMEYVDTIYLKGLNTLPENLKDKADLALKVFDKYVKWEAKFYRNVRIIVD